MSEMHLVVIEYKHRERALELFATRQDKVDQQIQALDFVSRVDAEQAAQLSVMHFCLCEALGLDNRMILQLITVQEFRQEVGLCLAEYTLRAGA